MGTPPAEVEAGTKSSGPRGQKSPPGNVRRGRFPLELWAYFGEEFRTLRTRIMNAFHDERHKIVLVTSSVQQEGKSTVSSNLARSFALAGRRTLLIDADLRRPDLHNLFGISREVGLSDAASGKVALEEAIVKTDLPELDLLPAGTRVESPAELINAPAFQGLLRKAAALYDGVVIDSPPLISITDTLLLVRFADGILMVVKGFVTPREVVKSALEQLHDRPVLGVVLNGISTPKRYGYYT